LKIYNQLGQEVKTILDEDKTAGFHECIWDGCDNNGLPVSSGIFFYRIQAGQFVKVKKTLFFR